MRNGPAQRDMSTSFHFVFKKYTRACLPRMCVCSCVCVCEREREREREGGERDKERDRQTDRQADRQTDRQTDSQTEDIEMRLSRAGTTR